jgi:hypothetical protein
VFVEAARAKRAIAAASRRTSTPRNKAEPVARAQRSQRFAQHFTLPTRLRHRVAFIGDEASALNAQKDK